VCEREREEVEREWPGCACAQREDDGSREWMCEGDESGCGWAIGWMDGWMDATPRRVRLERGCHAWATSMRPRERMPRLARIHAS
jgi:hypothetical protein